MSEGFAPFSSLSTYSAARRNMASWLTPYPTSPPPVATSAGPMDGSPRAVAFQIYGPLGALEAAATDSVLAHLVKLEADGRAEQSERGWRLTSPH